MRTFGFRSVAMLALLLAVIGATGASSAKAATGSEITGFLTLEGPFGEDVTVYCLNGVFQYSILADKLGEMQPSGLAMDVACGPALVHDLFPGHRVAVNTSMLDGWVLNPWSEGLEVSICRGGMETTLVGSLEPNSPPVVRLSKSTICSSYVPSPGA